jgi:hypothetical protein
LTSRHPELDCPSKSRIQPAASSSEVSWFSESNEKPLVKNRKTTRKGKAMLLNIMSPLGTKEWLLTTSMKFYLVVPLH